MLRPISKSISNQSTLPFYSSLHILGRQTLAIMRITQPPSVDLIIAHRCCNGTWSPIKTTSNWFWLPCDGSWARLGARSVWLQGIAFHRLLLLRVREKCDIAPSRRRVPLLGWFERFSGTSSSVLPLVSWISLRNQANIRPRKNKKTFFLKSCCYITGVCRTFPIIQLVCVILNSVWWDFPPIKESHSVTPKSGNLNNPRFYAEIPEGLKVPPTTSQVRSNKLFLHSKNNNSNENTFALSAPFKPSENLNLSQETSD